MSTPPQETTPITPSNSDDNENGVYHELHSIRSFDPHQQALLGTYIYALRDPRDNKVFYVGQGQNNRLFAHFDKATSELKSGKPLQQIDNRKIRRIIDVWLDGCPVEWAIIAKNVEETPNGVADKIESAVYDAITWSMNGMLMNEVSPPKSSFLDSSQILDLSAQAVCPDNPMTVFVCNIASLYGTRSDYDATRMYWKLGQQWRVHGAITHAVGLINGISKTAYEVDSWAVTGNAQNAGKYEFIAPMHPNAITVNSLVGLNWRNVLRGVGYWLHGNPIILEFDGRGKFRILRGGATDWQSCA